MASETLLDFTALTAPIEGENPAGDPAPYGVRQQLDAARKEEEANPDDPSGAAVPKRADWAGIIRTTTDLLTSKSKDLLLATRLVEALAREHGFAGLRDGLHLLADLTDQCWDRLHPTPDEGEGMEVRSGPYHWLSDPLRGARFPNTVRSLPLVKVDGVRYSLLDWVKALKNEGDVPAETFARATPAEEHTAEDLAQALQELSRLEGLVEDRLTEEAPALYELRQAMEECQARLATVVPAAQQSEAAPTSADGTPVPPAASPGAAFHPGATREELYRQVAQIAQRLEALEPHSPIPDLLRRAVELGKMPFRQLVRELIRDAAQLAELRREFGIKEPAEES